jgi:hypothetical protein
LVVIHLLEVLSSEEWVEFKPLFLTLLKTLRDAGKASGGEEMLRLRAYNALQVMVRQGVAERSGKNYRKAAVAPATLAGAPEAGPSSNGKGSRRGAGDKSGPEPSTS